MCADIALHEGRMDEHRKPVSIKPVFGRQNNPHVHILLTTRMVDKNGFNDKKCREWDKRLYVTIWRRAWADILNKEFERLGMNERVSHESYAAQGIKREPTRHLGPSVMEMELRGIQTERGNKHREVMARNDESERDMKRLHKKERNHERDR